MEPTPLTPITPQDHQDTQPSVPLPTPIQLDAKTPEPQSGAGHIDLGAILLPKKEVPGTTVASAQRVNAGALLEQEQNATLLNTEVVPQATSAQIATAAGMASPTTALAPEERATVQPIETYQRDIEGLVQDKNVSILSIAAAEAERRGSQQASADPAQGGAASFSLGSSLSIKNIGMYVLGFLLLVGASGALAYILERPTSVGAPQTAPDAPFIAVDDTKVITISRDTSRANLMATLTAAKQATALSLGLMSRLLITVASTTPKGQTLEAVGAQSFFTVIAPDMPPGLLQSMSPSYLLGVHVYDGNQPFLIMRVDSYEQAYASMLAWEPNMQQDLSPLFNYTPAEHIPEQGIAISTTTPQFIQTGFVDKIIENHDARVIQNNTGDVSLLWTFLDRNTLAITTNAATLREIISRLKQAPVTPVPTQ